MDKVRYNWIKQQLKMIRLTYSKKWFKKINSQLYWKGNNRQWLKVIQDFKKNIILNGLHSDSLVGYFG